MVNSKVKFSESSKYSDQGVLFM